MDSDQPDPTIAAIPVFINLCRLLAEYERLEDQLGERYPGASLGFGGWWARIQGDALPEVYEIFYHDDSHEPKHLIRQLTNYADELKELRRRRLDALQEVDPTYPADEEFEAYCAALDAQIAQIIKDVGLATTE